MSKVSFIYGALSDKLEKQANEQGYTLGIKAEIIQELADGLVINYIHGTLTDSVYNRALAKLHDKVIKECKPLKEKSDE